MFGVKDIFCTSIKGAFIFSHIYHLSTEGKKKSLSDTVYWRKNFMRANLIFPAVPATYHSKRGAGDAFETTACMLQHVYLKILFLLFLNTSSKTSLSVVWSPGMVSCFHASSSNPPLMWSIRGALYNSLGPTRGTFAVIFFFIIGFSFLLTYLAWGSQPSAGLSHSHSRRLGQWGLAGLCVRLFKSPAIDLPIIHSRCSITHHWHTSRTKVLWCEPDLRLDLYKVQ